MRKIALWLSLIYVTFIVVFKLKPIWPQKAKGEKKEEHLWQMPALNDRTL